MICIFGECFFDSEQESILFLLQLAHEHVSHQDLLTFKNTLKQQEFSSVCAWSKHENTV